MKEVLRSRAEKSIMTERGRHNLVQGTLKHFLVLEPILRRALVTQSRRNARQGVGISYERCLRYVLIPRANRAFMIRPDSRSMNGLLTELVYML